MPGCSRPPSLTPADFNYGADEYDAEGNEEPKALPEGSETMPYIDESPTMSPQLSARGQESGDGVSPTPTDGLGTGVGAGGAGLCPGGEGLRGSGCSARVSAVFVMLWCCSDLGVCVRQLNFRWPWHSGEQQFGGCHARGTRCVPPLPCRAGGRGRRGWAGRRAGSRGGSTAGRAGSGEFPGSPAPGALGDRAQRLRRAAGSI